jgi:hypothetical protein
LLDTTTTPYTAVEETKISQGAPTKGVTLSSKSGPPPAIANLPQVSNAMEEEVNDTEAGGPVAITAKYGAPPAISSAQPTSSQPEILSTK